MFKDEIVPHAVLIDEKIRCLNGLGVFHSFNLFETFDHKQHKVEAYPTKQQTSNNRITI